MDLVCKFHDGATLWVISPNGSRTHHVAAEFVHP
jgi:hypothetical protein